MSTTQQHKFNNEILNKEVRGIQLDGVAIMNFIEIATDENVCKDSNLKIKILIFNGYRFTK